MFMTPEQWIEEATKRLSQKAAPIPEEVTKGINPILETALGGAGLGIGGKAFYDINKVDKLLNNWEANINAARDFSSKQLPHFEELYDAGKGYSKVKTALSPEAAERLLSAYTGGASDLAKSRVLGIKGGDWMKLKLTPDAWDLGKLRVRRNIVDSLRIHRAASGASQDVLDDLAAKITDLDKQIDAAKHNLFGQNEHYKLFRDSKIQGQLNKHMLDTYKWSPMFDSARGQHLRYWISNTHLTGAEEAALRAEYKSIPETVKALDEALANGKANRETVAHLKEILLGGKGNPSLSEYVSLADHAGKPGVSTAPEINTKGIFDTYKGVVKKVSRGGKYMAGLAALAGLGGVLHGIFKSGSKKEEKDSARKLKLMGGVAATGTGAKKGTKALAQLIDSLHNPNLDLGITYGDWSAIGAGHKGPAKNIRKVIEKAIDKLPDNDPLKNIKILEIVRRANGLDTTNAFRKYNMLINTGLGLGRPFAGESWDHVEDIEHAKKVQKPQSYRRTLTDAVRGYKEGATAEEHLLYGTSEQYDQNAGKNVKRIAPGKKFNRWDDAKMWTWGSPSSESYSFDNRHKRIHLSGEHGQIATLTPLVDPDFLAKAKGMASKEDWLKIVDDYAAGTKGNLTPAEKASLKRIVDHVRAGKTFISMAGSGRGDYMFGRTIPLLEAMQRKGVSGDVLIAPLMGDYVAKNTQATENAVKLMNRLDSKGRIQAFGKLPGEVYGALQALGINMGSTGTLAATEAGLTGAINVIPDAWGDGGDGYKMLQPGRKALQTALNGGKFVDFGVVQLDDWNDGNKMVAHGNYAQKANPSFMSVSRQTDENIMKAWDKMLEDKVFKSHDLVGTLDDAGKEAIRTAIRQNAFNADAVVDLINNPTELKAKLDAARAAADYSISQAELGQARLVDDVMKTMKKNVRWQRLKSFGRVGAAAGMLGLGATTLANSFLPGAKSNAGNVGDLWRLASEVSANKGKALSV